MTILLTTISNRVVSAYAHLYNASSSSTRGPEVAKGSLASAWIQAPVQTLQNSIIMLPQNQLHLLRARMYHSDVRYAAWLSGSTICMCTSRNGIHPVSISSSTPTCGHSRTLRHTRWQGYGRNGIRNQQRRPERRRMYLVFAYPKHTALT